MKSELLAGICNQDWNYKLETKACTKSSIITESYFCAGQGGQIAFWSWKLKLSLPEVTGCYEGSHLAGIS